MIKIEPLFLTDYAQTRGLLESHADLLPAEHHCQAKSPHFRGLTFWQHWLPCRMHIAPSVYVAKEDGVILALISLKATGRSKDCWQIDNIIVHPHHRGRGIAQELLRYAFAVLGSQGVSHFIAEVADQNSAALNLFGSCGFCRCAKVTHYQLRLEPKTAAPVNLDMFRLAAPFEKQSLFRLHQDVLPPDIRLILSLSPEDFALNESKGQSDNRLRPAKGNTWFWVSEDVERKVLTCAVKLVSHYPGDCHLDFAIHPGWQEMTDPLIEFSVNALRQEPVASMLHARVFDFQQGLAASLEKAGFERVGGFCLLAREHWLRAKKPRSIKEDLGAVIPSIPNPAVNYPLATD